MPLKLDFKSGDKMIVNGAVLENIGPNAKLLVHNESAILREKEVLAAEETETPAARVYFALQCAYTFPDKKDEYLERFYHFLGEFVGACPSTMPIADEMRECVASGRLYKALKLGQKLIKHEVTTLAALQTGLEKASREILERMNSGELGAEPSIEEIDEDTLARESLEVQD